MKKKMANLIMAGCLLAAVAIMIVMWFVSPLILYGFLGLTVAGMLYGGYMNRHWIKMEIDKAKTNYHKEMTDSSSGSE